MSKKYLTPAAKAAFLMHELTGIQKCWHNWLSDNRRGKSGKELGEIPYQRISSKVYYNQKDLESVATVINLNRLLDQPFVKLF
jgi:hypothetical protein